MTYNTIMSKSFSDFSIYMLFGFNIAFKFQYQESEYVSK